MMKVKKSLSVILILFLLVLLNIIIYGNYLSIHNILNPDEYESIAVPFYLMGVKWCQASGFHGYGATILMTPFLKFFGKLGESYCIFLLECLFFRICCSTTTFLVSSKLLKFSELKSLMIAFICSFGTLGITDSASLSVMTETSITLISILLVTCFLLMYRAQEKSKFFWLFLSVFILSYSVTIHSRAIVLYLGYGVLILLYSVKNKKIKLFMLFDILSILLYFAFSKLNTFVISQLYTNSTSINTIGGIVTSVGSKVSFGFSDFVNTWRIFISLIESFVFYSFGIVLACIFINLFYIFKGARNKNLSEVWLLSVFGIITFFGMNLMLSFQMRNMLLENDIRWLTYTRYAIPFTWVLLWSSLLIIFENKTVFSYIGIVSIISQIVLCNHFISTTAVLLDKSKTGLSSTMFGRFFYNGEDPITYFQQLFLYGLIVMFVLLFTFKYGQNFRLGFLVSCFLYVIISMFVFSDQYKHYSNWDSQLTSYYAESMEVLKKCNGQNVIFYLDTTNKYSIYFESRVGWVPFCGAKTLDECELDNGLFFTDKDWSEPGYYEIRLSENQYVITKNKNIYKFVSENMK